MPRERYRDNVIYEDEIVSKEGSQLLEVEIPNFTSLKINKLVFDYNGTLACDGIPLEGVKEKLDNLAKDFEIYVLTADTFGTVKQQFSDIEVEIIIVESENGSKFKQNFVNQIDTNQVIAIGNGNNDALMLEAAGLGILVLGPEGAATRSLLKSDLMVKDIDDALEILLNPRRLVASLRK